MSDKREYSPSIEQIIHWLKYNGWSEITTSSKIQKQFMYGERRLTVLNNPMPTEYRVILGRLAHIHGRKVEELRIEITKERIPMVYVPDVSKPQRKPYSSPQRLSNRLKEIKEEVAIEEKRRIEEYKPPPIRTFPYWKRR